MTTPLHTSLTSWHEAAGATMSEFGGYAMPLWYKTGPIQEHRAVLLNAGLFDTSHMSEILVEGPDALGLLQLALTKDLGRALPNDRALRPGRSTYGFFLKENGHLLDDAIVMMEERERYLVVVNAGMGAPVTRHLLELGTELDVAVDDLTGHLCKIDLQGPKAAGMLRKAMKPCAKLDTAIPYFGFVGHYDHGQEGPQTLEGHSVLVSRTGYTGEFGFELFVRPDGCPSLWDALLKAGGAEGLIPCGLGARDSLRTGANLPLSHQDLGEWPACNHPWEFALCKSKRGFTKPFHGDQALHQAAGGSHTCTFRGENGRKVAMGAEVLLDDTVVGTVLTCATDMGIDLVEGNVASLTSPGAPEDFSPRGLSCGFIKANRPLSPGTALTLRDKRRSIPVTVVTDVRPDRTARMPWPAP